MLAAIIDRWQELEAQAPRIPTHVEALRLAAGAINRAQAAEDEKRYVGRTHLEQGTKPEFDGLSRHGCSRARRSLGGDLAAPSA